MAARLHVGLIGVGRIGLYHLQTLTSLDGVGRVTIADADGARAAELGAGLGIDAAPTVEALLERELDALVIATSTEAHVSLIRLGLANAVPVFCEKPVATGLGPLDELIADADIRGGFVQVGFQRRFDAGYRAAREAVATGVLGTLLVARAASHDPAPPSEAYIAGSGGIFRDLHIHDFDALRFVTGEEIVEIFADGAVRETPWFAAHDDVDAAVAAMRLAGGAIAILTGARRDPLGYDVRLELFGTADSVAVGLDEGTPLRSLEPGVAAPKGPAYGSFLDRFAGAYRAELAAFVTAVATGGPSPCTLADTRAALLVALAADRSRTSRRPVRTDEIAVAAA